MEAAGQPPPPASAPPPVGLGRPEALLAPGLRALEPLEVLLAGLLVCLILVSAVGNCLVCVAIFTDRRLRKLGNAFIVSLAIADLFVSCLVMTFGLCNELLTYWIFGDWFCDLFISFDVMCCTASILNLCAISLDRFVHIKDCLLYNQWMTRRVAISAVIIIWFTSGLVSIVPINLGWHRPSLTSTATTTTTTTTNPTSSAPAPSARPELEWAPPSRKLNYSPESAATTWQPIENQSSPSWANSARLPEPDFVSGPQAASSALGGRLALSQQQPSNQAPISSPHPRDGYGAAGSPGQLPVCVLTLTPTYAVVSSAISFYIPCLIMLGLYTKLFACARRHVRNIRAISKAPAPLLAPARVLSAPVEPRAVIASSEPPPTPLAPTHPLEQLPFLAGPSWTPQKGSPSPTTSASQQQQQQQQSSQVATHKAAVTLGIIMGTFLFCWVPFFCLNVIKAFCVDCIPNSVFRAFTWLGWANSALNPIIYGIHNSEFRCAFNRIFFKHLNFKNSRYYINRRLSYDLRHSATLRAATAARNQVKADAGKQSRQPSCKSDTLA